MATDEREQAPLEPLPQVSCPDDRKDDPQENEDSSTDEWTTRWVDPLRVFDRERTVNVCCSHAGHCGDLESYFNTRNSKLDWHGHSNIGGANVGPSFK